MRVGVFEGKGKGALILPRGYPCQTLSPSNALTLGPSLLVSTMDITTSSSAPTTPSSQDSLALPNQTGSMVNDITLSDQMIFSEFLNTASTTGHFTIDLGSPIPGFANLYKLSWDVYVTCRPTTCEARTYHAAQVRAFIKFDVALQASEQPSDLIMPAGYDEFMHIINTENFSYRLHMCPLGPKFPGNCYWLTTQNQLPSRIWMLCSP
jgi:hypothetical protein